MKQLKTLGLLLLLGLAGCVHRNGTQYQAEDKAKGFVMSQPTVTARTGAVKQIMDLSGESTGRNMPFGWGDRAQENYIFNVEGERDSVIVRVALEKRGKEDWRVASWGILDANDAAQYQAEKSAAQH